MKLARTLLVASLAVALAGVYTSCDDNDVDPVVTGDPDVTEDTGPAVDAGPFQLGPLCNIDETKYGKKIGDVIGNITLKTWQKERYDLHANCGYDVKLVWVVLGTGWCGACEALAPQLEPIYQQYKDKGLAIMWVLGEDAKAAPPSIEFAKAFVEDKGVTFPVMRDLNFLNVYSMIKQHSTALPHQYLIDANTMELLDATGGINPDFQADIISRLE